MKQPYWKPQHEVFIRCMLRHGDATKAYRAAYPKASKTSARVGGIRLNSYSHIRHRIQPLLDQQREEANKLAMQQALVREKALHARRHHIRTTICALVHGEMKKDRRFIVNGKAVTVQQDISHGTLLDLIFLDFKLANSYDRWATIERQFARLTHNTSTNSKADEKAVALQKRQQTVINLSSNPMPKRFPNNVANLKKSLKSDNKTTLDNNFLGLERYFDTALPHYLTYKENLDNDRTSYVKKQ
ncbi:hypothetical protein [Polluticoccus soli]|uniref:hypothetical protein n=1 Tax=Polluticoccus soli TaxID=3034150 RepID=UPI0023E147B3|nr:hypothetical protein [Flavipsychrobacter sp. JY13-12]